MHSKRIIEKVKQDYDQIGVDFSNTRRQAWSEFDAILPYLKPGIKILDLGCGNGRFLDYLEKHLQEFDYLGLDQSAVLIAEAKKKHPKQSFVLHEMSDLHSLEGEFDLMVAFASFHHLPKKSFESTLRNWREHLKEDGHLLMTNWNLFQRKYWKAWLQMLFFPRWGFKGLEIPWAKKLKRYYYAFTLRELEKLHIQSSFKLLKSEKTRFNLLTIAKK